MLIASECYRLYAHQDVKKTYKSQLFFSFHENTVEYLVNMGTISDMTPAAMTAKRAAIIPLPKTALAPVYSPPTSQGSSVTCRPSMSDE
jgi:hypothetical protein